MDTKKVTLKDIAAATGLSVNSVSLALRGIRVSPQTRQRVQQAAEELGYVGNAQASSIRSGITRTVAVIVGDIANPYTAHVLKGCAHLLSNAQYSMIIFSTEEDEELESQAIRSALRQNVDGVLISPVKKDSKNLALLAESGVPSVVFGSKSKYEHLASVCLDDEMGGYLATEYLIRQGYQRVLLINGPLQVQGAHERMTGYLRAMEHYRLRTEPEDRICADLKADTSWQEPLLKRLQQLKEPTALLAYSDMLALLIYSYCADHDLSIGAIAGFDNALTMLPAALRFPSVAEKDEGIASAAPRLLLDRMQNPQTAAQKRVLEVALHNV